MCAKETKCVKTKSLKKHTKHESTPLYMFQKMPRLSSRDVPPPLSGSKFIVVKFCILKN